jgi:hypothetical protein
VDGASNVFVAGDAWAGFANYYDFTTIRYSASSIALPSDPSEAEGRAKVFSRSLLEQLQIGDDIETEFDFIASGFLAAPVRLPTPLWDNRSLRSRDGCRSNFGNGDRSHA